MIPLSDYRECVYALEAKLIVFARRIWRITAVITPKYGLAIEKKSWIAVLKARVAELETTLNVRKESSWRSSFCASRGYKPYKLGNNTVKKKRKGYGKGWHTFISIKFEPLR
jgi:hypothetical protein